MSDHIEKYHHWQKELQTLDSRVKPLINAPYTGDSSSFYQELHALGLKSRADVIVQQIVAEFPELTAENRRRVSELVNRHGGINWLTDFMRKVESIEAFRMSLTWFVIMDQGKDTRDAILELESYISKGKTLGYPVKALLQEISRMASEQDRYGWGSTQDLILKRV